MLLLRTFNFVVMKGMRTSGPPRTNLGNIGKNKFKLKIKKQTKNVLQDCRIYSPNFQTF